MGNLLQKRLSISPSIASTINCMCSYNVVKRQLGQVVARSELPSILQVESHCTGEAFSCGHKAPKSALCEPYGAIINLEPPYRKRSEKKKKSSLVMHLQWGPQLTIKLQ